MEINTKYLDEYIDFWHQIVITVSKWKSFPEWEASFPVFIDSHAFVTKSITKVKFLNEEKDFGQVLREVRKNLILTENLIVIQKYSTYVRNSFDEVVQPTFIIIQEIEKLYRERLSIYDSNLEALDHPEISDIASVYGHSQLLYFRIKSAKEILIEEINTELQLKGTESIYPNGKENHLFKWKGTPAQLAFIINLWQTKGYIEGLTPYGERDASIVLSHFEIEGYNTTPESLGRCFQQLKKDELPINSEDAAKFLKIPNRKDLKR